MKPYDIDKLADLIVLRIYELNNHALLTNLKLQKLLYYVQAWHLGINKCPFVCQKFLAWIHGPVCREIYDRFKETKSLYSLIEVSDVKDSNVKSFFDAYDVSFVDYILENYAGFTGSELEQMTHNELPWISARRGCQPTQRCDNEISEIEMMNYYGEKWEKINSKS